MAAGSGFTDTVLVVRQPLISVYVMVVVPVVSAVITPDVTPIVATAVLLLVHDRPPEVASVYVAVLPKHIAAVPDIAAGSSLEVTAAVL
jgi:hypothetical protein